MFFTKIQIFYNQIRRRIWFLLNELKIRAWLIELIIAVPIAVLAHLLWELAQFPQDDTGNLIEYVWRALPVLAISNALPMLGATAVLARYAVAEKPAETFKQILDVLTADDIRLNERKANPVGRMNSFRRAMRGAPDNLVFFKDGEPLFTPRPYWDGVWFFPTTPVRTQAEAIAHEITYCAVRVIDQVYGIRDYNLALVGGTHGGTNGSKWFLEDLKEITRPKIGDNVTMKQSLIWVSIAQRSVHYMMEEIRVHRESSEINELRATEFIAKFCEYMKWLGFFHAKVILAQWIVLMDRHEKARDFSLPPTATKMIQDIHVTRLALDSIAAANLPRRATANRVAQVRKGIFLPLLSTLTAILTCLALKPLSVWQPELSTVVISFAYALIAASFASSFGFGLWLLSPTSEGKRREA